MRRRADRLPACAPCQGPPGGDPFRRAVRGADSRRDVSREYHGNLSVLQHETAPESPDLQGYCGDAVSEGRLDTYAHAFLRADVTRDGGQRRGRGPLHGRAAHALPGARGRPPQRRHCRPECATAGGPCGRRCPDRAVSCDRQPIITGVIFTATTALPVPARPAGDGTARRAASPSAPQRAWSSTRPRTSSLNPSCGAPAGTARGPSRPS
jgi:hypothetical protein